MMTHSGFSVIIIILLMGSFVHWSSSANLRGRELRINNMDVSSSEQSIKVGSFVSLQCNVHDKEGYWSWKSCAWRRLQDNKSCKSSYVCVGSFCFAGFGEYKIRRACDWDLKDATFLEDDFNDKKNTLCGLEISEVRLEDSGEWICRVQKCTYPLCAFGSNKTIEARIQIKVYS